MGAIGRIACCPARKRLGLEGELQAIASDLEAGAHAGAAEAAETPEIAGGLVPMDVSVTWRLIGTCVEPRPPDRVNGGRQAVADPRGD